MGRRPKGEKAMTNAERQKSYRERKRKGIARQGIPIRSLLQSMCLKRTFFWYSRRMMGEVNKWDASLALKVDSGELTVNQAFRAAFFVAVRADRAAEFGRGMPRSILTRLQDWLDRDRG